VSPLRRPGRWFGLLVAVTIGAGGSIGQRIPRPSAGGVPAAATPDSAQLGRRIPFRLVRNKVILPVRVNASRELSVILGTGMPYDGLLHDRFAGFPTDGVTGYSLLGHYAVEIDYDASVITLHDPGTRPPDDSWHRIQISFRRNQVPWVEAAIDVRGDRRIPVSLYIDLASSEALKMLIRDDMRFSLPEGLEEYLLGRGPSGDVRGYRGRIASLELGPFSLHDVATAFAPAVVRSRQPGADGVLSNDALRRFNVLFDNQNASLNLRPNSQYHAPFRR